MKDKNYEGLANRLSRTVKVVPVATTLIFSVSLPDLAFAQTGIVEVSAGHEVVLESIGSENLVLDSQQLSIDVLSPVQVVELTVVDETEVASPAPAKLALVEQAVDVGSSMTGMVKEQVAVDAGSESAGSESPQKPYALILALVALISLVPISRRHQ